MNKTTPLLPVMSLWIGKEPSVIERLSMASFIKCGHPYELYTYQHYDNLPQGVVLKDANEILPERDIYFTKKRGITSFSNWFRWELLTRRQGWWADTDMICLRPLDFSEEFVVGIESNHRSFKNSQEMEDHYLNSDFAFNKISPQINNALVKCTNPNHPVIIALRDFCRYPHRYTIYMIKNYDDFRLKRIAKFLINLLRSLVIGRASHGSLLNGPWRLTDEIVRKKAFSGVKNRAYFYPVHYRDWKSLLDSTYAHTDNPFPDSYTVHFWNKMIDWDGNMDKNQTFAPNSFIEQMKIRYLDK